MTICRPHLVAACAALFASLNGPAHALTIAADGAPQATIRVAGSSAASKAFGAVVNVQLCEGGTNTVYWDDRAPVATLGAEDGARHQAYYCRVKTGISGIAAGARLLVVKRDLKLLENTSTAEAINCIRDADPALVGQELALGVVSLENVPGPGWKYVKLDGVSPNFYVTDPDGAGALKRGDPDATQRKNVILGHYLFAMEGAMIWRTDSAFAGDTGPLHLIANGLTSPSLVSLTGVYSVRSAGVTHALFPNRVHKGTRYGNSCRSIQLLE